MAKEIKIKTGGVHDPAPPEEIKIVNPVAATQLPPAPKPMPTGENKPK